MSAGRTVRRDAATDGLPGWAWPAVLWLVLGGWVLLPVIGVTARSVYIWILHEDHPVEWTQFAVVLLSSVIAGLAVPGLSRRGLKVAVVIVVIYMVGAFVLAGEEISWGQRVFGLATPADLESVNRQHELNLHNIDVGVPIEMLLDLVEFCISLVGAGVPLLTRLRRRPVPEFLRTLSPPLLAVPLFAQMLVYQIISTGLTAVRHREYDLVVGFQEWAELCMYTGLVVTTLVVFLRSRSSSPIPPQAPAWTATTRRAAGRAALGAVPLVALGITLLTIVAAVMTVINGVHIAGSTA
jgi:hypothetical protein